MGSVTETMNGTGFPPNQSVGLGPAAGDTESEDGILCRTMRDKETGESDYNLELYICYLCNKL